MITDDIINHQKELNMDREMYLSAPFHRNLIYKIGKAAMLSVYKIDVVNVHNIPNNQPAIFAANHSSFIDANILSSVIPRPVRFYADDNLYNSKAYKKIMSVFKCIPVSEDRKVLKKAIQLTLEAKQQNDFLCIFPEGGITFSGEVNKFKRGIEVFARRSKLPVIPVAIGGLWGSIYSRKHYGSLKRFVPEKLRREITVTFGDPISHLDVKTEKLEEVIKSML